MNEIANCRVCGDDLTDENWYPSFKRLDRMICNLCVNDQRSKRDGKHVIPIHKRKHASTRMDKNKRCTLFLGVHVAERVLSNVFKHVERMPIHNPGYDFICNRGKKIDVKSSCINKDQRWKFKINQNKVPDFFLVIAFDNRKKLNPMYMWLIPGDDVCRQCTVSVAPSTISKWDRYRLDIKKVITCCKEMRS